MDVLRLVDKLEALVTSATKVPITSKVLVDEQEVLDIIDQMRVAFPEELRQAKKLSQERERLLNQAQSDVDKIVAGAREQAAGMVANSEVVVLANRQADETVGAAMQRANDIRRESDSYAVDVLSRLEAELQRLLAQCRKGRTLLEKQGE